MLNIGYMTYANIYPLYWHLRKDDTINLVKGVPTELNTMLNEGKLDLSPVSCITYAYNSDKYLILPDLSISSTGKVKSVILFSNFPIENLDNKNVFLTAESGTSVELLKIIFKEYIRVHPNFTNNGNADAKLLIGDTALTEYYKNSYKYKYDLPELWLQYTGLPFVFSVWLTKVECKNNSQIIKIGEDISRIAPMVASEAPRYAEDFLKEFPNFPLTKAQLVDYWQLIRYDLGVQEKEALSLFFEKVIKRRVELNFI